MCVSLFVDFGDLINVVPLSVLFMRERDLSVDDGFCVGVVQFDCFRKFICMIFECQKSKSGQ